MYFEARYYDPISTRFISPDPLFAEQVDKCIGSVIECNLYQYTGNNPVMFVDLDGKEATASVIDGKKTIEWGFNVELKGDITVKERDQYLSAASKILTQNDVEVVIKHDPKAKIEMVIRRKAWTSKVTGNYIGGRAGEIGATQDDSTKVEVRLNARSIAHEVGHRTGLRHPWDPKNDIMNNGKGVKGNLLNSYGNPMENIKSASGVDLTPLQSKGMYEQVEENE